MNLDDKAGRSPASLSFERLISSLHKRNISIVRTEEEGAEEEEELLENPRRLHEESVH